jgi:hypothetical protein
VRVDRPKPVDTSEALLAEPCKCPVPIGDDGTCVKCGRNTAAGQQELSGFDAFLYDTARTASTYPD